ncbi:MAG: Smr/MutS family protein [bacterium]
MSPTRSKDIPGLDLHGMTPDAAIVAVERFVNRQFASRAREVMIVHGRGQGKLKAQVQKCLSQSPLVKRHFGGLPSEGSDGVTIAVLEDHA